MDKDILMWILGFVATGLAGCIAALWVKVQSLEVKLAGDYHQKVELEKLFDLKLGPLVKLVERIEKRLDDSEDRRNGHN